MYNKRDVNNLYDYVNVCYSSSTTYSSHYDYPYDDVNDNDGYTYSLSRRCSSNDDVNGYYVSNNNNDYDSSSYSCYDSSSSSHVSYRYDDYDSSSDHCCCYDDGDDCIDSFKNF